MPPAGFRTANPASERPHTHALDRLATGISSRVITAKKNIRRLVVLA
jgi:hypothetical protein